MSRVAQNLLLLSLPSSVSSTNLDHRRFICDRLQKLRVFRTASTHHKPFRVYCKLRKTRLNERSVRGQSRKAHLDAYSSGYDDAGPRKSKPLTIRPRLEHLSWIYREEVDLSCNKDNSAVDAYFRRSVFFLACRTGLDAF